MRMILDRTIALGVLLIAATTIVSLGRADQIPPPPPGSETIAVPAGHRPFLVVHARGVQTYTCSGTGTWGPASVPQADLISLESGNVIGTHFGGPTWQLKDGSFVKAAKVAGVTINPNDIPWLKLSMTSAGAGAEGDRLAKTTYILRVNTVGGIAPVDGCTPGATVSVPYEADYYFYCAEGGN